MGNYYMTAQSRESNQPSTFVINGDKSLYSDTLEQQEVAKKMASTMMWEDTPYENLIRQSNLPEWFHVKYKAGNGYYITSCFNDEDECGRKMGFQFFSDSENLEDVVSHLTDAAKIAERNYNIKEIHTLLEIHNYYHQEQQRNNIKNKRSKIVGSLLFSMAAVGTAMLVKSCDADNEKKIDECVPSTELINKDSITIK